MKLSKVYQPKEVEEKIYNFWQRSGFFNPDKLPKRHKKPYCIVIPPPNITGSLHMGHALNATIQDVLIRWKRMQGFKTLWLPGTDHAGIATQNVVEKELKKEGLTRFDLGREKFLERVWQWKKKYGETILEQFKKLGCSLDWSRTRFTLDDKYSKAVKTAFYYYYKKGWIYRGKRPINWCSRCQTSLSDLEIEYQEEKGKLWYIKYPLVKKPEIQNRKLKTNLKSKNQNYITVATTRPETMLGDTAVAVNPKDTRYKRLAGKKVLLPLVGREIPVIADRLVNPQFGSGAVKVTPAHSLVDYEISLRHNLPIISVIDEKGKMTNKVPLPYQGLKVLEAREKVIENLNNKRLIEKIEDYPLSLPKCYRCQTTLETLMSEQWFLKMDELAKKAEEPVKKGEITFHPKSYEKVFFDWLKNIKDWCISRQIWWGHQIPVWYCQTSRKKFIASAQEPKQCPFCKNCKMEQSIDVLDTWFSSALWPFATLGWPNKTKDLKKFYPTDILSTGRDIINLWVTRMIFSAMEFMKKIPFKDVYIHATVLNKEGKRMSKSLGTGIDPLEMVKKYGADASRFGIIWQITGNQDIKFGEDNIIMGKKFCNKIWNASRFVLLQVKNSKFKTLNPKQFQGTKIKTQNLTAAEKRILKALEKTKNSVDKDLEGFQFGKAAQTLYDFFWHDFCDIYIEKFKIQSSKLKTQNAQIRSQKILLYVLLTSLKLLHPFIPFISEEIYQQLPIKHKERCLMIAIWP